MFKSKQVSSSQHGLHPRLNEIVAKHIEKPYLKPIQQHNQLAFGQLQSAIKDLSPQKLILDSCCGTGMSTRKIAEANTNALVVGIDQSASRLNRNTEQIANFPQNALLLRTNCEDFWRLCADAKLTFEKHYILYPNPYPKAEHLKRRWHGHPCFPALPKLTKNIELRSNWLTYLKEFEHAWQQLTGNTSELYEVPAEDPLTLFERKYTGSGQTLFKLSSSTLSNDVET